MQYNSGSNPSVQSHLAWRKQAWDVLSERVFDVLVIGGGIVGAGVAREAALRGLQVALVDQADFAFGTSSRSTRLLHGGLRYLAQGRLRLVYEASREKVLLARIAPHLCQPLPFLFPVYPDSPWPRWQLVLGTKLYDLLCGGRNFVPARALSARETLHDCPLLRPQQLKGAVRYFDALTNDARLVIDTLRSAHAAGAVLLNYAPVLEAWHEQADQLWRCRVRDEETGNTAVVRSHCVVHATGPWAERLPQSAVRLRLTKGVHLVIPAERLPLREAVVMSEGQRILFAIPWGERIILGTTDTDYRQPIEDLCTEPEDIEYILDVTNRFFPRAAIGSGDILACWAGLRPLIHSSRGGPSDISRRHVILQPQPGWFDVAGGKLTTYRLIGEQVIARVCRLLHRPTLPGLSKKRPLLEDTPGGKLVGIVPPEAEGDTIDCFCRHEWAVHLDDVMLRRSSWHFYRADRNKLARLVAERMARLLGWDEKRMQSELRRYDQLRF